MSLVELRQFEYFLAVAEERHFTRAAARCHVSQSALSASIRALEHELGTLLFTRSTRSVELTAAGEALIPEAQKTVAAVHSAGRAVEAAKTSLNGTLSIGGGCTSGVPRH